MSNDGLKLTIGFEEMMYKFPNTSGLSPRGMLLVYEIWLAQLTELLNR